MIFKFPVNHGLTTGFDPAMSIDSAPSARSGIFTRALDELTESLWPMEFFFLIGTFATGIAILFGHLSGILALLVWLCFAFLAAGTCALPVIDLSENTRIRKRLFHLTEKEKILMDAFAIGRIKTFRTDPEDECVAGLLADGLVREVRHVAPDEYDTSAFVLTARAAEQMGRAYPLPPVDGMH